MLRPASAQQQVIPGIQNTPSRKRIPAFLDKIQGMNDSQRLCALVRSEISAIKRTKWTGPHGIARVGYTPSTLRDIIGDYRKAIVTRYGNHEALKYMVPSRADTLRVNTTTHAHVLSGLRQSRSIDFDSITRLARTILRDRQYHHIYVVSAALILITGRRPIEIFKCGDFFLPSTSEIRNAHEHISKNSLIIMFTGQAKTRGRIGTQQAPYPIPILAPAQLVLSSLQYLRQHLDFRDLSNMEVAAKTSALLIRHARKIFCDADGNSLGPKDLRGVYATIAGEYCRQPSHQRNSFFSEILGHSDGDVITSMSYMGFYESGSVPESNRKIVRSFNENAKRYQPYK